MVALNVGAQTIAEPESRRRLLALLDAGSALAGRLIFEMTEFGALQNWELTRRSAAKFAAAARASRWTISACCRNR